MCGRAAVAYSAADVVRACRAAGCSQLPPQTPRPRDYAFGKSCKNAKDKSGKLCGQTFPVLMLDGGATLTVRTQTWGMRQLNTHNIWVDDDSWLERKTWRACIEGGQRCAVIVTAFAEGITCRRPDDALFFLAALHHNDAFVILTTNSLSVPLLASRAEGQAGHGAPTRCPLWMDAEAATRWVSDGAATPPAAVQAVRRIEEAVRGNRLSLVLGAAGKAPAAGSAVGQAKLFQPQLGLVKKEAGASDAGGADAAAVRARASPATPQQREASPAASDVATAASASASVAAAPAAAPAAALAAASAPPEAKPMSAATAKNPAAARACPACTLLTEDAARATCEVCGCDLDRAEPAAEAKRRAPEATPGETERKKPRSIESFFRKAPRSP